MRRPASTVGARGPRSCTCATPASCASPPCSPATGRASRPWCRSPRSARSRSQRGRSSSTSATTCSSPARSSPAAAASCRSWSTSGRSPRRRCCPLPNLHTELSEETRVRQRYLDLIVREQARAHRARPCQGGRLAARHVRRRTATSRSRRRCCRRMHGGASARPFVTHSRTRSTPSCTCASRPSCSSSAPSSAASSGSSRSTATSATRAPTPRTRPSSRCSRRTRRTATTTRWPT